MSRRWTKRRISTTGPMIGRRALGPICLVAMVALVAPGVQAAIRTPALILKPNAGPPTSTVKVSGTGFGASETVNLKFDNAGAGSAMTDALGSFVDAPVTVPASALPGKHKIKATGQTSGLTASKTFTVRTDWTQFKFAADKGAFNPYENVVGASNVASLVQHWVSAPVGSAIDSSPGVAGGKVFVTSGAPSLKAYPTACSSPCSPLWTTPTGYVEFESPAVAGKQVFIGSFDHKLYAMDTGTGAVKWIATTGDAIEGSPTVSGGVVYTGSDDYKLYAFPATCSTPCLPLWTGATGRYVISSPAVSKGKVFVGSSDYKLYAFPTSCSNPCTPSWTAETGSVVNSSPAVAGGVVYVGSNDGKLYAFKADTGAIVWVSKYMGAAIGTVSPAVANGMVYIGSNKTLFAFPTSCSNPCAPAWTAPTGGQLATPSVANGVVYVGSSDDHLYAFPATCSNPCTPLWSFDALSAVASSPAVSDGVVYIGANSGKLYAFGL